MGNRRATGRLGALLEILLLAIVTTGCASGRFSSDTERAVRMDRTGDDARAVQIGREQSQYGQQLISAGRMRIDAGGDKIRRGERLIERGAGQVAQSRRAYESAMRETNADESRLLRIRERWDEGIDFIRVGNALIGDGRRDVERGSARSSGRPHDDRIRSYLDPDRRAGVSRACRAIGLIQAEARNV
jgi:hypothetical protein